MPRTPINYFAARDGTPEEPGDYVLFAMANPPKWNNQENLWDFASASDAIGSGMWPMAASEFERLFTETYHLQPGECIAVAPRLRERIPNEYLVIDGVAAAALITDARSNGGCP